MHQPLAHSSNAMLTFHLSWHFTNLYRLLPRYLGPRYTRTADCSLLWTHRWLITVKTNWSDWLRTSGCPDWPCDKEKEWVSVRERATRVNPYFPRDVVSGATCLLALRARAVAQDDSSSWFIQWSHQGTTEALRGPWAHFQTPTTLLLFTIFLFRLLFILISGLEEFRGFWIHVTDKLWVTDW